VLKNSWVDCSTDSEATEMSEAEDKTASLLAALWLRIRPIVEERLATLDQAATTAAKGQLTEELRKEAQSSSHKLAGALGMYGYDEGTRIAREIEQLLETSPEPARFSGLIAELRAAIFLEG
jgi:HPt (histidine-containing phosphotransfer) domain-containing protein